MQASNSPDSTATTEVTVTVIQLPEAMEPIDQKVRSRSC